MDKIYIIDDIFKISEEVQNMSEEETDRQIAILEAEGRKEKEKNWKINKIQQIGVN